MAKKDRFPPVGRPAHRKDPGHGGESGSFANGPLAVLIIDDDRALGDQLVRFLQHSGLRAIAEINAFAGASTARRYQPAIILLDVEMPGMDGITAADVIHQISPRSRIILMSGHQKSLVAANRSSAPVFGVLEKPVPLPAILDFVRRALHIQDD